MSKGETSRLIMPVSFSFSVHFVVVVAVVFVVVVVVVVANVVLLSR